MNNHHDIHNFSCKSNKTGFSLFILGPEHIFNLSSRTLLPSPSWSWSLWSVSAWWELAQWTSWKLGGGCRPAGSSCWLGPRPGIQSTTWTLVWPALSFSHHHSYQSIVFSQLHEHWRDQLSLSLTITAINQSYSVNYMNIGVTSSLFLSSSQLSINLLVEQLHQHK